MIRYFCKIMTVSTLIVGAFPNFASSSTLPDWHPYISSLSGDAAPALQSVINMMCGTNGGTLELGVGIFHLKSTVIVKCPISIIGQGWEEAPKADEKHGTWISIENSHSPGIVFTGGSKGASIQKIAFTQPAQQLPTVGATSWHPVPMPPVIMIKDVSGLTQIRDIYMNGVDTGIESINGGRTYIDGLYGQFFSSAIKLYDEMDISRINNVHSWPYLSGDPLVISFQQKNLNTIVLGRADGVFIDNVFAYAAKSGVFFEKSKNNGAATGIQIGKLECDSVQHCVQVDSIGATMMISEMRQFGQKGIDSGFAMDHADAFFITGEASILASNIEARMIDQSFITASSNHECSNIRIGNAFLDFSKSKSSTHQIVSQDFCGIHGEKNEILFAVRPAVLGLQ